MIFLWVRPRGCWIVGRAGSGEVVGRTVEWDLDLFQGLFGGFNVLVRIKAVC